jgi:hypothetical protein
MDIIDFTKKRLNSKPDGLPITVCPHCGRKGQHTKLPDNAEAWRHRVDGMFAVDACSLKPDGSWSETRCADAVEMVRTQRSTKDLQ